MPKQLFYTFGNHMHWVDMEWLWGYEVLPGCIDDMLHYCRESGSKGNVNFDGVGYEKLAAENPDALQKLREAIADGTVEPVGCSYGQPYGLFHGGESNIRQRVYGVRTAMRLLGKRPTTFWEEELDFFPQLPQMLLGVGYEFASLFFQWTWHTPEIPREEVPVVRWTGLDGSSLITATRNDLNLHQWPEDMQILFDQLASSEDSGEEFPRLILQWLELMPSKDWMCRSEVVLPKMKELLKDPRFEIRFGTLPEYLAAYRDSGSEIPERRYSMDEVWHGMTLGKNGYKMTRDSRKAESALASAELLHSMLSSFGRPYPRWDVYPVWELEESWRELLQAQHHDNEECEGLCGHVGKASYSRSLELSRHVLQDAFSLMRTRVASGDADLILFNPLGWPRSSVLDDGLRYRWILPEIPGYGYFAVQEKDLQTLDSSEWNHDGDLWTFREGELAVEYCAIKRSIRMRYRDHEISLKFPDIKFNGEDPLREMTAEETKASGRRLQLTFAWEEKKPGLTFALMPLVDRLSLSVSGALPRPKGGLNNALSLAFPRSQGALIADHPYGVTELNPAGTFRKKYPSGDWMTSPQWFEEVRNPFVTSSFVDIQQEGSRLLICHNGSSQWFAEDTETRSVLTAYDPWDEEYWRAGRGQFIMADFTMYLHSGMSPAECWKRSQETRVNIIALGSESREGDMPPQFQLLDVHGAVATSLYRESEYSGKGLDNYAGKGIGYPYVLRLVEFDGKPTVARVQCGKTLAWAAKTNLMGEIEGVLPIKDNGFELEMRGHEIATVYLDIVEGRKQPRDLDAARGVWATVHRQEHDKV